MAKIFHSARVVLVLLLLAGIAPRRPQAQAMPAASGPGGYIAVGAGASIFQFDYGQRKLGGIMAYADVNPVWRYGLEGEVRSLRYHTDEGVTETTYLGGPRVAIFPGPLRPYVKFLAGAGKYELPFSYAQGQARHYAQGTFLTYAPGAGVDLILNDAISVRVIDFEYQVTTNFQATPGAPYSQLVNYGISSGITIRLTPLSHFPNIFRYKKRSYGRGPVEE